MTDKEEIEYFILLESKEITEDFEIIIKTNFSEPFWGKVVNKNKNKIKNYIKYLNILNINECSYQIFT